jgi:NAD(P)-dependent dehydrogenase (short-subunit alcohol dehydrogenase family)
VKAKTPPQKTVLITGTSSGFGRELVSLYLEKGWTVLATLRNLESRKMLFDLEKKSFPDRFFLWELDVSKQSDRENITKKIDSEFGACLDCLVNNAGFGLFGALEDLSEVQIREQMEVNFFGALLTTQALLPSLRKAKGRVILLSSICGFSGLPLTSAYCASKYALEGFSESLYFELKPHGVQVCLVEPDQHKTEFGKNTVWGEKGGKTSCYQTQTNNYHSILWERRSASKLSLNVVKEIMRLSELRTMPLRKRCGAEAKLVYLVKKLLPEKMAFWILSIVFNFFFSRKRLT